MIPIESPDNDLMFRKYENGKFSDDTFKPLPVDDTLDQVEYLIDVDYRLSLVELGLSK
ncbi:hypothetical protein ACQKCU_24830 [Heyndrickxia sporothermodurans]